MEPDKISVVIVSFNRVQQLREALGTLRQPAPEPPEPAAPAPKASAAAKQSAPAKLQIIVVDNGSRDGAAGLVDEFPDVRFSRLPRNFGLTRALNIGIRAAEGDYILLLHDDVLIEPSAVIALADFLESHPDVAAVCPRLNTPQARLLPTPSSPDPAFETPPAGDEVVVECVSGAAMMVRAHFLRSMGQIDERYGNYGSAIEICAKIRSSSRKVAVLGGVTAVHTATASPMPAGVLKRDRASGTAAFIGKHHGFGAGVLYRLKTASLAATKVDGSG